MHGAELLIELGGVVIGLAVLARVAGRFGLPSIPLFLLAGLAFGEGGLLPLVTTAEFIEIGAEIGLILLLFMLGLEYSAAELIGTMRGSLRLGVFDLVLNLTPGLIMGLALGWDVVPALFLGGITYTTSSGIVAKLLYDMGRIGNRETPTLLSVLVMEDLAMAVYLPVMGGLLYGGLTIKGMGTVLIAGAFVLGILTAALKVEVGLSKLIFSHSDEALLLTILGLALVVAGVAEAIQVSAAVGALLVGIMLSGPAAEGARAVLSPLRDLFAALFFVFFGLSVDPGMLAEGLLLASILAVATAVTKFFTGYAGCRWNGIGKRGARRAGFMLIPRGEFSIAIATVALAGGAEPDLAPLSAAYVLLLAVIGPLAVKIEQLLADREMPATT